MHGGTFYSVNTAERKQPCCLVQFGRTEPSPSNRVMPLSKLNRACKPLSRAQADPPLSLLGLIPGLDTVNTLIFFKMSVCLFGFCFISNHTHALCSSLSRPPV